MQAVEPLKKRKALEFTTLKSITMGSTVPPQYVETLVYENTSMMDVISAYRQYTYRKISINTEIIEHGQNENLK
jgi:hypothetical protein